MRPSRKGSAATATARDSQRQNYSPRPAGGRPPRGCHTPPPEPRMHHYLRPLLSPQSVALVGASERAGSLGRVVFENLLGGNFRGELHPVNPNHAKVLARRAYGSIADIGSPV